MGCPDVMLPSSSYTSPLDPSSCKHCKPRKLPLQETLTKMFKNSQKALEEHVERGFLEDCTVYASLEAAVPPLSSFVNPTQKTPLTFEFEVASEQGKRKSMEDAHFYCELEKGIICGIFDGHGGAEVANYVSQQFEKKFPQALAQATDNVQQAFEILFHDIHSEIIQNSSWMMIGTTAVLCFIEKATNIIFTATLGDSEATIYRKIGNRWQSVPISCVRDWGSPKDFARAQAYYSYPINGGWDVIDNWQFLDSKERRFHPNTQVTRHHLGGLNVSRALGDQYCAGTNQHPTITHKPKITINTLLSGDFLILACDGLKDFVSEKETIEQLTTENSPITAENAFAKKLVNFALYNKKSTDNVTVIVVKAR